MKDLFYFVDNHCVLKKENKIKKNGNEKQGELGVTNDKAVENSPLVGNFDFPCFGVVLYVVVAVAVAVVDLIP